MYIRFSALLPVAALAALAAAAPNDLEVRAVTYQCNTGSVQCCNNTYSQSDYTITSLFGLLGITLPNAQGLVGLGCSPITGAGTGTGATCTQQAVCCTGNTFNGVINVGCSPINVNG